MIRSSLKSGSDCNDARSIAHEKCKDSCECLKNTVKQYLIFQIYFLLCYEQNWIDTFL